MFLVVIITFTPHWIVVDHAIGCILFINHSVYALHMTPLCVHTCCSMHVRA